MLLSNGDLTVKWCYSHHLICLMINLVVFIYLFCSSSIDSSELQDSLEQEQRSPTNSR